MKRILPLLLILVSTPFFGQTYQTWRTEATDNIWQTNNNWWNFPNGSPIVFGQQEWDNNHQLSQQSTADVNTWRFLYKAGASSTHTFSGNKIRFFDFGGQNPSIINESSVNQIINNNIEGDGDAGDPMEIYLTNGNLTFNGSFNNMGSWLDIYGNNGKSLAITGAISGNGGLAVKQNSTVTISNANNTYAGNTSVDAGTLIVQKGGHSASITSGAIAFTFASTNQAAGTYDFLPGQLTGSTSRTLTSNLVAGKSISFNYTTGDVTICDLSTAPTSVSGITTICSGTSTTLTVNGGFKGTGAVTQWFTGSCGGTLVGTGDVLNTGNLTADTTYYVRYSGTCNDTSCAQVTVTVTPLTTNGSVTTSICEGQTYVWPANGQSYTTSQTNVTHVVGCNTATLNLTVSPLTINGSVTTSICQGETYVWPANGQSYTTAQTNLTHVVDCNTATLNLTITPQPSWYLDADADGYYVGSAIVQCDSPGAGYTLTVTGSGDCNDGVFGINPGASEINFNGIDEDCDASLFNGHAPVVSNITTASGTLAAMTTTISCSTASNTLPYSGASVVHKFRVTRTSPAAAPVEFLSATRSFSISQLGIAAYSATYDVQATAIVNGEEQPYNGNTATFTTPAAPVITLVSQVVTTQCNQTLATINSYIYANNSTMYNNAQIVDFEVERYENNVLTHTQVYSTNAPYFRLSSLSIPVTYGTLYKVRVRYGYNSYGSEIRSNWSTQCNVTTPSMPLAQVLASQCGQTLASINSFVYASGNLSNANLYEFKVTRIVALGDPTPAVTEETIQRIVPYFRLNMLTNLFIGLGKEYSVEVRYRVNSFGTQQWSNWGTACSVFTPEFPTTGMTDAQCSLLDFTPAMNQYIYADAVAGATQYRFRLELFDELSATPEVPVYSQYVDSPDKYIRLNQFTGLTPSTTYVITVSVELYGEFGPYGKDCSVNTPDFTSKAAPIAVAESFEATAYPNPYTNNFMIEVKTTSQSVVSVKVFDMVGRLVEERKANVSDIENTTIGDRYPSGVYSVVITQDDAVKTLRVIKR